MGELTDRRVMRLSIDAQAWQQQKDSLLLWMKWFIVPSHAYRAITWEDYR